MYQTLWIRYVQGVFGNTAKTAALVLGTFFLGMALGSVTGGWWAQRARSPLRLYGWLEGGVALAAIPALFLLPLYQNLYTTFFPILTASPLTLECLRILLTMALLLPASLLLGATFPVMGCIVVRHPTFLGRHAASLYGVNILGAVSGVAAAGFVCLPWLGASRTYLLTALINLLLGGLILWGTRGQRAPAAAEATAAPAAASPTTAPTTLMPQTLLLALAYGSGGGVMALEVLWTRMFALVLHNSVYTFAALMMIVLLGLALGAAGVSAWERRGHHPGQLLPFTLALTALSILLVSHLFVHTTQLTYFAYGVGWPLYLWRVLLLVAAFVLFPMLCAGMSLPLLWGLLGRHPRQRSVGATLGLANFYNLLGAVTGALGAGFILLPLLGLWQALAAVALLFLVMAQVSIAYMPVSWGRWMSPLAIGVFVGLAVFVANPSQYQVQRLKPGERLLYLHEGEESVVAVVEDRAKQRWLKSQNTYRLGATVGMRTTKRLGHLPLLLHPAPRQAAFVGVATGLSLSAGLAHEVERLIGIEILPGVLGAAPYFAEHHGNVLQQDRVTTVVGDGRIYLRSTEQTFDVIIADLFVPWSAGTGSLYTLEHYRASQRRLRPGGLYCQWLPLYQLSAQEFGAIAAAFTQAFPYVTLWRGDFSSTAPILGLVGSRTPLVLDLEQLSRRLQRLQTRIKPQDPLLRTVEDFLLLYIGDMQSVRAWLQQFPTNTDDRPWVEFQAPISQAQRQTFQGERLVSFVNRFTKVAEAAQALQLRLPDPAQALELSPRAGNLLFQAVEFGRQHKVQAQLDSIKEALALLPQSHYLHIVKAVLQSMDTAAPIGIEEPPNADDEAKP